MDPNNDEDPRYSELKPGKRPRNGSSVAKVIMSGKAQLKQRFSIQRNSESGSGSKLCNTKADLIGIKSLLLGNPLNILLLFIPLGFASHFLGWSATMIFFMNFIAMIPLANILGDATESLAEHLGENLGGLFNATFGNAVEIVVMIMALLEAKHANGEEREVLITVVQTSLIGSIFSNSLLVLGCAFLANGIKQHEGRFSEVAASENVSLLLLAAFVMILPAPYSEHSGVGSHDSLMVSRAAAIVLLLLYGCLMVFVLHTHAEDMEAKSVYSRQSSRSGPALERADHEVDDVNPIRQQLLDGDFEDHAVEAENGSDDESKDELSLSMLGSMSVLCISTIFVSVHSQFLVASIDGMAKGVGMSPAFVGIILLPIIGNAVEHLTAVRMAWQDKMDVAIAIAIGSATQVAMLVVGLAVLIAWGMGIDLDLAFNPFEVNIFLYSAILIFTLVSDGRSNWLEGAMLVGLYVLVAVAVWPQDYGQ